MSGATPICLLLSVRQTEALSVWLKYLRDNRSRFPSVDEVQALREVADKLDVMKGQ